MTDVYASHLPILKMVLARNDIETVLEFGVGDYSTSFFLDRTQNPWIRFVESYEDDRGWLNSIYNKHLPEIEGGRFSLVACNGKIHDVLSPNFVFDRYDLIFVDNGANATERSLVLEIINKAQPRGIVVVHDYEVTEYQEATRDFPIKEIYSALKPWTAVLYSKNSPQYKRLDIE